MYANQSINLYFRHMAHKKHRRQTENIYNRYTHIKPSPKMLKMHEMFASYRNSRPRNTMVASDYWPEWKMALRACAVHSAIIGTLQFVHCGRGYWGRYHVPQNPFLVLSKFGCHGFLENLGGVFEFAHPVNLPDTQKLCRYRGQK